MVKKMHVTPKLSFGERRKREKAIAKNRHLRIDDGNYSEEMRSKDGEVAYERFENHFRDDEACDERLLEYLGWKEVENSDHKRGVVLVFKCDEVLNNACASDEAIKLPREEGWLPYTGKVRWVYQCKKCGSQFNLYTGTIFNSRKKTDIWIWFLCLYTMYLLDGKIPRSWLKEKYVNYLIKQEVLVSSHYDEKKKVYEKMISERIKRITSKIYNNLFCDNTKTGEFAWYKNLIYLEKPPLGISFTEWQKTPSEYRTKWKIAIRKKDYPTRKKEVIECAESERINEVYCLQYFKIEGAVEIGDWILQIKIVPDSENGYWFNWLHVDRIIKTNLVKSECKWQAIQLKKMPTYHYRPFRLTNKFKELISTALDAYRDKDFIDIVLNEVISCPDSILLNIANEF